MSKEWELLAGRLEGCLMGVSVGVDGLEPWKEKAFQGVAQEVFGWQSNYVTLTALFASDVALRRRRCLIGVRFLRFRPRHSNTST